MAENKKRCRYCEWVRAGKGYHEFERRYFCSLNPPSRDITVEKETWIQHTGIDEVDREYRVWSGLPQVERDGCCRFFRLRHEAIRFTEGWWTGDSLPEEDEYYDDYYTDEEIEAREAREAREAKLRKEGRLL